MSLQLNLLNVLPDCRTRETRGVIFRNGVQWIPLFCANCGKDGGFVPADSRHAFYLCDSPCGEQWGQLAATYAVPDEVFWAKANAAQIEKYGRSLTEQELLVELDNDSSIISKLSKEK